MKDVHQQIPEVQTEITHRGNQLADAMLCELGAKARDNMVSVAPDESPVCTLDFNEQQPSVDPVKLEQKDNQANFEDVARYPITFEVMRDAVITPDGHCYGRAAI
jgi:hypothetical protein